jgi:hypothetical protein
VSSSRDLQDIPLVLSTGPLNAQAEAFVPRSQATSKVVMWKAKLKTPPPKLTSKSNNRMRTL